MKVINIYGAPGAGKSTTAAGLFYQMKRHWVECEYVQEYAKELVWSGSSHMLSQQNYIFAEQEYRLNRLADQIDCSISDSPLLLSSFYAPRTYPESFHQLVFDFFNIYDNVNIFVQRSHEYSGQGRLQKVEESDFIAQEMKSFLFKNRIPFVSITASDASPKRLLSYLVEKGHIVLPSYIEFEPEEFPDNWIQEFPQPQPWQQGDKVHLSDLSSVKTVG